MYKYKSFKISLGMTYIILQKSEHTTHTQTLSYIHFKYFTKRFKRRCYSHLCVRSTFQNDENDAA